MTEREKRLNELDLDFSDDESARESMEQYIRENFSDVLGDKINLLDADNGFDLLLQEVRKVLNNSDQAESKVA